MKMINTHKQGIWGIITVSIIFLGLSADRVYAENPAMRILARPLTPQEISDYSLPSDTQIASGNNVVGIGQPVYLEFLLENGVSGGRHPIDFVTVTQVVWSLDYSAVNTGGGPLISSAGITASLLPTNMPTYDGGHQQKFSVIDRAMIVPDVRGKYSISVEASTVDNGVFNITYDVVAGNFLGNNNAGCLLCHASKQAGYNATHHAVALKDNINDTNGHFRESCIQCHSLGYDTAPAADNGGFDDVAADLGWEFPDSLATNNWDDLDPLLQAKSNVQCESCHGPSEEHVLTVLFGESGDPLNMAVNVTAGVCSQCHDKLSHHVKSTEWGISPHAVGYVFRDGSCGACHSTVGFINANDPGMNEVGEEVQVMGTSMEGITCAACHDPHSAGTGVHQVRSLGSVELANGFVIDQGGNGLVCMACHHDRYEANERAGLGRTPHHGTQTDMLFGMNAIEYGQDMPSSKHWDVVEDTCVQCHMQDVPPDLPAFAENQVGGHSFMLSFDDGTNAVYLTETCASCHGEIEDFNFGGADFDLDGMVEGVQAEISDMMAELGQLLDEGQYSEESANKANYNLVFVTDDGSHGVHNPKYAAALLRSSIDDLKGGIDIDKDGLVDAWEIEQFGSITSQSGSDDYDGDGLTNEQEENIGTDPVLIDSDSDGISDLTEIQGGSNPLDINSVPASDMVILPATEVGYMPQGTNTTVQFQVIKDLSNGSWEDIGSIQTNNGVGWMYQLDSYRGTTSRFYRAIEE